MSIGKWLHIAQIAMLMLLLGVVIYLGYQTVRTPDYGRRGSEEFSKDSEPRNPATSPRVEGHAGAKGGDVILGGLERPVVDLTKEQAESDARHTSGDGAEGDWDYGQTPPVKPDANEQVASVYKAVQNRERDTKSYAKAVSGLAKPDAFDKIKYANDEDYRQAYLSHPQPSRVFQTAPPGPGVPRLRRMTPPYRQVVQGETTQLKVRAIPGAPVTFTSFDLGRFENELTSITVEADAAGFAEVAFWGPPGTIDDANILIASPVTSGQVKLIVNITRPQ